MTEILRSFVSEELGA